MSRHVRIDDHPGGVRQITLDRPDTGNALTGELMVDLHDAVRACGTGRDVRAVLLTGAGGVFCLGADVAELRASLEFPGGPADYWRPRLAGLASLIRDVAAHRLPFVAALDGQAAGAGLALALACDVRVASTRTALNLAYGALGSSTDGGMVWLLTRTLGPAAARRLLLTQPTVRARRGLELGLVDDVVTPDELAERALRTATDLAGAAPHAIRAAKRLLATAPTASLESHMELEHEEFLRGLATADFGAGLAARLAGTSPVFDGE